jgi:phosphotransferase system enzyme I (PtsP)
MAGDPAAAILLFAMGFDHLSMSVSSLLRVKWLIRTLTLARAEELLGKALILESAEEIRSLMTNTLEEIGLGSLYRAGK